MLANTGSPTRLHARTGTVAAAEGDCHLISRCFAGLMARTYDIELDACFKDGRSRIDAAILSEVHQRIGGDTQIVTDVKSRYEAITYKHLLLPVWLLAYKFHERTYQVFINARYRRSAGRATLQSMENRVCCGDGTDCRVCNLRSHTVPTVIFWAIAVAAAVRNEGLLQGLVVRPRFV